MTEPNSLVGINGFGGAGKDAFASILIEKYGFERHSFADLMRAMAEALNPIVSINEDKAADFFSYNHNGYGWDDLWVRYLEAKETYGYDESKFIFDEFREILQRLGTAVGREILGEDFWVNETMKRIHGIPRVVIPDMRFFNEAHAIRRKAGATIRIERPGVGPANDHISEVELIQGGWNFENAFNNDGSLEDLEHLADLFVRERFPWILR